MKVSVMGVAKVAISIDSNLLNRLDYFVEHDRFKNRSQAIQTAVAYALKKLERQRLAQECMKLDATLEQGLADEGIYEDLEEWPEF